MRQFSEVELKMLVLRHATLKPIVDRYNYCLALYPEVLREYDDTLKRLGLNRDTQDHPDVLWAKANVDLVEDELDIAEQEIANAIRSDQLDHEFHLAR